MNKFLPFLFAFIILSSIGFSCVAIQSTGIGQASTYSYPIWVTNGDCSLSDIQTNGYTAQYGGMSVATGTVTTSASTTYRFAQSMTPAVNTEVDSVTLRAVVNGGYSGDADAVVNVRIETDNAGNPSGTLVSASATTSVNASDLQHTYMYSTTTQAGGAHTWVFPSTVSLTAGTPYHIVINLTGSWSSDYAFAIQYSTSSTYASGNYKLNTGASWTNYAGDAWFMVNTAGITQYTYDAGTSKGIVGQNYTFYPTGTGAVVIGAGETLTFTQPSVAGQGYDFYFLYAGGGGLKAHGTRDNPAWINSSVPTYRKLYGIYAGYSSNLFLDYLNYDISATNTIMTMLNGGSDMGIVRGGWWNNWYSTGTPGFYMYSTDTAYQHQGTYQFYGVTFNKTGTAGWIMISGSPSQRPVSFINCDFNENIVYANGILNTRGATTYNTLNKQDYYFVFAGCRRNGVPLDEGDIYSYSTTAGIIFGNMITPTVVDSSNLPLEGVVVTATPQFGAGTDVPYMFNGRSRELTRGIWENDLFKNIMFNVYPRITPLAVTNASGVPVDDIGMEVLWSPYTFYSNSTINTVGTMNLVAYLGGSNASIRSTEDNTWANDGTDEGTIVTFSHATYGGNLSIINPSTAFTSNVTLGSGGGAPAPASEDYEWIWLPLIIIIATFVFMFYKIDSETNLFEAPMKYLFAGLALIFIWVLLTSLYLLAELETAVIANSITMITTSYMWIVIITVFIFLALFMKHVVKNKEEIE